jgi:hypothetical protein
MDIKKTTEVVVMGSMLALTMAAPLNAYAATAIAPALKATTAAIPTGSYVLEAFTLNISANVGMQYDAENPTMVAVTTANQKGMHTFGGTSNGGSVKQCEATSVATPTAPLPNISLGCPAP